MKANRFTSKAAAQSAINAAFDVDGVALVLGIDRIKEIGRAIYAISGGFSCRRVNRPRLIFAIAGAYQDLKWLDVDAAARARAWLDSVTTVYRTARDLTAYPNGIDIANPRDNAAAEVFFAETTALHTLARGDLHTLTAFYLLYKRDWQDCQELQADYFSLTGKYYGDYPVM